MNKILVEIICGATSESYDFWLPKAMPLYLIMKKLMEDICEFEDNDHLFPDPENAAFFHTGQQVFLNQDQTVLEAGIKGGDAILIV